MAASPVRLAGIIAAACFAAALLGLLAASVAGEDWLGPQGWMHHPAAPGIAVGLFVAIGALLLGRVRRAHEAACVGLSALGEQSLEETASRLERVAYHDQLTSVANRQSFHEQVDDLLRARYPDRVLIAKVDVSGFHEINTSFGYDLGDALLKQIAVRLRKLPNVLLGRVGADEFAVATDLGDADDGEAFVAGLRDALQPKFVLPGATLEVRFSIGFTIGRNGDGATTLCRQAGVAVHASKSSKLHETRRFDARMDSRIRNRVLLTHELQQAVVNGDFSLHYQPKVDLGSGVLVGAEALIRWCHPVFGSQLPDRFIGIAEETGLILDMGEWAMRSVARFACQINRGRSEPLSLAVNVSPVQFANREMVALVEDVLYESGADPSWLTLELTESLCAESSPEMISTLRRLRELGCGVSIDDFGTGYSSLRYLETFPLSEIKIDRSFVKDLHQGRFKRVVVEAVIKVGMQLQAVVTAEGLETIAEMTALRELGCPYGQGYLFGAAIPSDEFAALARENTASPLFAQKLPAKLIASASERAYQPVLLASGRELDRAVSDVRG